MRWRQFRAERATAPEIEPEARSQFPPSSDRGVQSPGPFGERLRYVVSHFGAQQIALVEKNSGKMHPAMLSWFSMKLMIYKRLDKDQGSAYARSSSR